MWFVTVSITGSSKGIMKPGDTDPVVAYVLKDQVEFFLNVHSDDAASRAHFSATLQRLVIRSWQMKRGGSLDWWDPRDTPSNDMTYTCDADLGSPALVDCAQIQWQDLGSPSDTITVGPDVTKFLSQSENCSNTTSPHDCVKYILLTQSNRYLQSRNFSYESSDTHLESNPSGSLHAHKYLH